MRNHLWMALGLVAGLVLGLTAAATGNPALGALARGIRPFGTLFLNLLQMVVIPLVGAALFVGVAGLGDLRRLGRLGSRAMGFFLGTAIIAIVIGFATASLLLPLAQSTPEQQAALRAMADSAPGAVQAAAARLPSGARFLIEMVPANPLKAAADGSLLPFVVFITIFAVAATTLPEDKRRPLLDVADTVQRACIKIVHWVLWLAPFGIFALVAGAVAQFGWSLVKAMLVFVLAVALGTTVFVGAIYIGAGHWLARKPLGAFTRALFPPMLMGFSTTSSLATLPTMFEAAERDLGLSRPVASLVLPLGASVNRAGSALYQAVAVLFTAQLFGVPIGAGSLVQAGAAVFLASLTVAGVPGGSAISLIPAFTAIGLPISALSILLGLDRVPDMFRTAANVAGHMTGAAVIDGLER